MIGATLATTATGGGALPLIAAATAGGAAGSAARGDDLSTIASEGATQGALQGGLTILKPILKMIARGTMRGGIPKPIQSDFGGREVAQEALDVGAIPGSTRSAQRITRLSNEANQARDTVAQTVPSITGRKIIDGLKKIYDESVIAKMPDRSKMIADRAGEIRREVGTGLDGPSILARKGILQQEGRAALNAPNPKMAAVGPQLANAEREALVAHLRETPGMETALNTSQRRMGLDRFMQDSLTSNMATRMGGGPMNVARSPMGLGITAHAVNQGSKLADPQLVRALMILLGERSNEQ